MKRPVVWIVVAAFAALLAKLYCAATTTGTNDVNLFVMFGRIISENGLTPLYSATRMFNHTPLVGTATALAYELSGSTHMTAALSSAMCSDTAATGGAGGSPTG